MDNLEKGLSALPEQEPIAAPEVQEETPAVAEGETPEWFGEVEAAVDAMKANIKGSISPKDDINDLIKALREVQQKYGKGKKKEEEVSEEENAGMQLPQSPIGLL